MYAWMGSGNGSLVSGGNSHLGPPWPRSIETPRPSSAPFPPPPAYPFPLALVRPLPLDVRLRPPRPSSLAPCSNGANPRPAGSGLQISRSRTLNADAAYPSPTSTLRLRSAWQAWTASLASSSLVHVP